MQLAFDLGARTGRCQSEAQASAVPHTAPPPSIPAPAADTPLLAVKAKLRALEGANPRTSFGAVPFGDPEVDACLPTGGLALGRWHEIVSEKADAERLSVATGFAASRLACMPSKGAIVWALAHADLYAPGLSAFGLDPGRILFVQVKSDAEALAVMEDALRTKGLAAVVGEVSMVDLVAGKRLQLACEHWGAPGFVLRRQRRATSHTKDMDVSAAATRWRIAPAPGDATDIVRSLGAPRWRVALDKCRNGRTGAWIMESAHATGHVRVVSRLVDHTTETRSAGAAFRLRDNDARGGRAAAHGG